MSTRIANTAASILNKTVITTADAAAITALFTFNRSPSAPFAVQAGSAVVTNLDADKVDGQHGSYYNDSANLTGVFTTNAGGGGKVTAPTTSTAYLEFLNATTGSLGTINFDNSKNFIVSPNGLPKLQLTPAGVLTVTGLGDHTFTTGSAGAMNVLVQSTTNGTTTYASFQTSAGTSAGGLYSFSQGFTTSGVTVLSSTLLRSFGVNGLILAATDAAGVIRFFAGGTTEAARILATGCVLINATAQFSASPARLAVKSDQSSTYGMAVGTSVNAGGGLFIAFTNAADTTQGSVSATNSTTTAFNTSSDRRMKRDLGIARDLRGLRSIVIHDFEWIDHGGQDRGVFAQEAYEAFPRAITPGSNAVAADGRILHPWMTDYSKFVPDVIAGWQEHDARIVALEARIAQLIAQLDPAVAPARSRAPTQRTRRRD